MELLPFLRQQARANRLANARLHRVMQALDEAAFHAPRVGFFPSLAGTLNHILDVDLYYLLALEGEIAPADFWDRFVPASTLAELAERQAQADARFIAVLEAAQPARLDEPVRMARGGGRIQQERFGHIVAHLLNHQVHHRGQVHAMLSSSAVQPPQLDEFLNPSEAEFRTEDLRHLGWTEAQLFAGL